MTKPIYIVIIVAQGVIIMFDWKGELYLKKLWIIIIIVVSVVALAVLGTIIYINYNFLGDEFETGIYVFVNKDGGFWQMNDSSISGNLFKGLETGDEILVYRSSQMAMSYPGQCSVKLCIKRADGNIDDVHSDAIEALKAIGWIS